MLILGYVLCPKCERITEHIIYILSSDQNAAYCQFICLDPYCDRISDVIACDKVWIAQLIRRHTERGKK